ncbi:MAG TPA: hypothetical protein VGF87_08370 [Acidimicrobiales bacterium]
MSARFDGARTGAIIALVPLLLISLIGGSGNGATTSILVYGLFPAVIVGAVVGARRAARRQL